MDGRPLADLLGTSGARPVATFGAGVVTLEKVLAPAPKALGGCSGYKRLP